MRQHSGIKRANVRETTGEGEWEKQKFFNADRPHPEEARSAVSKDDCKFPWFETRQRVRAKRGPMINSDALLTMRSSV